MSKGTYFRNILERREVRDLKPYALISRKRRKIKGFREYDPTPLEYRTEYHRDRDRIVWSKTFKRLQHKTQIFPHYVEDHFRRRLTHSLEVAQIATTVARSLGLNEIATEAMAMGHDLGHTPFGHAGEATLNKLLLRKQSKKYDPYSLPVPVFGFDHCVHAIEVVCRIEDEYSRSKTAHSGLNLSVDVRDGILKHMYDRDYDEEKPHSNIPMVVRFEEYKQYKNNKGSLEAQCVYFADKLAYLFGDIEDGIRCGVFSCEELSEDTFLKKIWASYNKTRRQRSKMKLRTLNDFLEIRRRALTSLILDCIDNANRIIKHHDFTRPQDVLKCGERLVHVSDDLRAKWEGFYDRQLKDKLFKHHDVMTCEKKAGKIVEDLFDAFMEEPDLIPQKYRDRNRPVYDKLGVSDSNILHMLFVRNYVAGMTDAFAIDQHIRLFSSAERVRFS